MNESINKKYIYIEKCFWNRIVLKFMRTCTYTFKPVYSIPQTCNELKHTHGILPERGLAFPSSLLRGKFLHGILYSPFCLNKQTRTDLRHLLINGGV